MLSVTYDGDADDSNSGSWSATQSVFFVAYKAGSFFTAAYDEPAVSGATWNTSLLGLDGKGMSHITLYDVRPTNGPEPGPGPGPAPIPLPAAAWMLMAGLGGLVSLRRLRG